MPELLGTRVVADRMQYAGVAAFLDHSDFEAQILSFRDRQRATLRCADDACSRRRGDGAWLRSHLRRDQLGRRSELIGDSMLKGMRLGPKASAALDRAQRLAPDNPRVALQRGVSLLFSPPMFGGGAKKAIVELERARSLFAQQSANAPWPSWGQVDAYAWLGQALAKVGRLEEARAVYHTDRQPVVFRALS